MAKTERKADHGDEALYALRHSTAHVMAGAVLELFPGAKFGFGPPVKDGFYYDFDLPRALTPDDLGTDRGEDAGRREARRAVPAQGHERAGRAEVLRRAEAGLQGRSDQEARREVAGTRTATTKSRTGRSARTSTTASSISARVRTSRRPARSARSSCSRSPARTGAATSATRSFSASTARRGRIRSSSMRT